MPYSPHSAFLNVPYDLRYERLFLPFVAGLCAFGLRPRATLEIPGPGRRLDRIVELMQACRYSFHDLSRVQLSSGASRFNMPFELGLAVLIASQTRHQWFVFEERPRLLPPARLLVLYRFRRIVAGAPTAHAEGRWRTSRSSMGRTSTSA